MATDAEIRKWRKDLASGLTIAEVARRAGKSRQTVSKAVAGPPATATRIRVQRNVRVKADLWDAAAEKALSLGITNRSGPHPGAGNVGEMIEMIGAGHLDVIPAPPRSGNERERD